MGVQGLWQLLQTAGRPVTLESLEGQVLAVDVSIWLNQSVKGMRDKHGSPLPNAHLITLFNRICKLLYYRIKPVFVFDGGVPALKKQTLAARRQRKEQAEKETGKTSQKILTNFLKRQAVQAAIGKGGEKATVPEIPAKPSTSKEADMYQLPPLPEQDSSEAVEEEEPDPWEERMLQRDIIMSEYQDFGNVDIDSEEFRSFPPEVQHEILTEIKETKKRVGWSQFDELPQDSDQFSGFQIAKIVRQNKLSQRIEDVRKEMNHQALGSMGPSLTQGHPVTQITSHRIVSEDTSHAILIKGLSNQKPSAETAGTSSSNMADVYSVDDFGTLSDESDFEEEPLMLQLKKKTEILGKTEQKVSLIDLTKKVETKEECIVIDDEGDMPIPYNTGSGRRTAEKNSTVEAIQSSALVDLTSSTSLSDSTLSNKNTRNNDLFLDQSEANETESISINEPVKQSNNMTVDNNLSEKHVKVKDGKEQSEREIIGPVHKTRNDSVESDCVDLTVNNSNADENGGNRILEKHHEVSTRVKSTCDSEKRVTVTAQGEAVFRTEEGGFILVDEEKEDKKSKGAHFQDTIVQSQTVFPDQLVNEYDNKGEASKTLAHNSELNQKVQFKDQPVLDNTPGASFTGPSTGTRTVPNSTINATESGKSINGVSSEVITEASEDNDTSADAKFKTEKKRKHDNGDGDAPISSMPEKKMKVESCLSDDKIDTIAITIDPSAAPPGEDDLFPASIFTAVKTPAPTFQSTEREVEDWKIREEHLDRAELEDLDQELIFEERNLRKTKGQQERLAATVTEKMQAEAQELLQLFGIPYVVSPMEAEAQCAQLDQLNLTSGSITDDSDIWLFGGRSVYKNFFNQNKHVERYKIEDIEKHVGLDRRRCICVALVCGSDYTEGLQGAGPVTAMEILSEFPGEDVDALVAFREWWQAVQNRPKPSAGESKTKSKLKKLQIRAGFPSSTVIEAYLQPTVEDSRERFSWGRPDLDLLREFGSERCGWTRKKVDEMLLPVMKQLNNTTSQNRLDKYFTVDLSEKRTVKSKRLARAIDLFHNPSQADKEDKSGKSNGKTKGKKKMKNESRSRSEKGQRTSTGQSSKSKGVKESPEHELNFSEPSSEEDEEDKAKLTAKNRKIDNKQIQAKEKGQNVQSTSSVKGSSSSSTVLPQKKSKGKSDSMTKSKKTSNKSCKKQTNKSLVPSLERRTGPSRTSKAKATGRIESLQLSESDSSQSD
ncbi:DNA repair protein complementing XP-G cells homolog isoform X2 [Lingula anatina]|uniref:DNA repair protein complementing XP-G cells homolog isoform X2 n=1 Tax=Lingula anatina TaxID=7574 RepID=A0A1S3KEW8_LINAN|nr:DNA repair protein complementing XP-G cells homolog isoform X2 [Lingula anatina]|eukprot:XP_013421180.1 DNA repair protein complementing XP-G cells homolog isoform X2 [Lingula anatina]